MRYQLADGITSVKFVRPAHRLIALWGNDVIKVSTLGLQAGRDTLGHRFMAGQIISIATPESYESQLRSEEHTSELQSLMRISYAVFCLKKQKIRKLYRSHN